ncbi:signal recognition particle-docking protein FtsY [bacterium (candidate division B38) B3_B38]|nr:MAG: signal recognition particle-docking protein FtsY [bacterium (candidate division B38) B3_B38]
MKLQPQEDRKRFQRLRRGLLKTQQSLTLPLERLFKGKRAFQEAALEQLEEILIEADVGVATTREIIDSLQEKINKEPSLSGSALKEHVKDHILSLLQVGREAATQLPSDALQVVLVVGVNGSGKTTTIAKMAYQLKEEGKKALLCAADTFRAAAIEQLEIWAERVGVGVVKGKSGSDPAAVVFDAIRAAIARGMDFLIIDTAGRLHTKRNLMNELEKIRRIIGREVTGAPQEVLLVLDAMTGQNGISQAEEFLKFSGVTGVVLAKLDGTAKGGVAVAIARSFGLPIKYVGVGEGLDDLLEFSPPEFVEALFSSNEELISCPD